MADLSQEDADGHFSVLEEAQALYEARSRKYGQAWRNYGAINNIGKVAAKTDRLMEVWWHSMGNGEEPSLHKDALDDAFDLINYAVFFIRNARDGNFTGQAPVRPGSGEQSW